MVGRTGFQPVNQGQTGMSILPSLLPGGCYHPPDLLLWGEYRVPRQWMCRMNSSGDNVATPVQRIRFYDDNIETSSSYKLISRIGPE